MFKILESLVVHVFVLIYGNKSDMYDLYTTVRYKTCNALIVLHVHAYLTEVRTQSLSVSDNNILHGSHILVLYSSEV